jgi:serine/threonine-protein kinase
MAQSPRSSGTEAEQPTVPGANAESAPVSIPGAGIGDVVDTKYRVESVLGAGGMGIVVAARHIQLGHTVAIKFLRPEALQDGAAASRFLREARAAVAITSEHVARVLDLGTLPTGSPYIVMEHLLGHDLSVALQESGPFAVSDAVGAVLQACEALAEAHARGIVHRDLKPSNLFVVRRVDGSALVKVLDFGISRAPELGTAGGSHPSLTKSGFMIGSPAYMSPEQIRNAKSVDARADVWALGVILYELLSGTPPFAGETLGEVLAKVIADPPLPLRDARPEVPEGLAQLIGRCLERDPARRVQSVAELAAALRSFAGSGQPVFVPPVAGTSPKAESATAQTPEPSLEASTERGTPTPHPTAGSWKGSVAPHPTPRSLATRVAFGVTMGATALLGIAAMLTKSHSWGGSTSAMATVPAVLPTSALGSPPESAASRPAAPPSPATAAPGTANEAGEPAPRLDTSSDSPTPAETARPARAGRGEPAPLSSSRRTGTSGPSQATAPVRRSPSAPPRPPSLDDLMEGRR